MNWPAPATEPPSPTEPDRGGQTAQVRWSLLDCLGVLGLTLVVAFGLTFALVGLVTLLTGGLGSETGPSMDVLNVSSGAILLLVMIATPLAWVRLRYPGHARDLLGWRSPNLRDVALGLGLGLLGYLVVNGGVGTLLEFLFRLAGTETPAPQQNYQELVRDPRTAPYFIAVAVVLAPVAEELFFRGMLFRGFARRLGVGWGIVLSALLFALLHLGGGASGDLAGNVLLVGVIFPLGLLLAWVYHHRGTLVVPILIHGLFNLIAVVTMTAFSSG